MNRLKKSDVDHCFSRASTKLHAQSSPRTFQAFQLIAIEGWPPKQAAAFLKMIVDSVYQAKARVLRHVRQAIERVQREEA